MSASKLWLITFAFMAGTILTPLILILTTGDDDASLPGVVGSPMARSPGDLLFDEAPRTATPGVTVSAAAPASVPASPTREAPTAASPAPAATPAPPATQPPRPEPPPQPAQGGNELPPINGRFRITDTITSGQGAGMVVSFDVVLQQDGATVSGGNSEITLAGQVQGATLRAQFVQPRLGYTGTFTWVLDGNGGSGTFVSSVPNSGTSTLQRL